MRTSMRAVLGIGVIVLLGASAVFGQSAGEVLWTVDLDGFSFMSQPRVAPDGTIYVHTNTLYAISPAGTILWSVPLSEPSYVDLGPDGTVYAGSGNTIYAFEPDGTLKWSFTENPAGQGLMQGPTVGPDGNIYAVSDLNGLGAFSLTPAGNLRWNVPGFGNTGGTGLGRVEFGPDRLYFADDWNPAVDGCQELREGMSAVTFGGALDWCNAISGVARPTATLDGLALTYQQGFSGKTILAYEPDGDLAWTFTFGFSPMGIGSIGVGSDNNLYVWHDGSTLASLTADGDLRWEEQQPIANFPWRAVLAPDRRAVVSGSVFGFGNNGDIVAADPANGSTLWKVDVTGPSAGAGAPAEFSPDGDVVYVPVNTVSFDVPDQLWAIQVHDADQAPALDAEVTLVSGGTLPPSGGTVRYQLTIVNDTTGSLTTQYWIETTQPDGRIQTQGPFSTTIAAGATFSRNLKRKVSARGLPGTYTVTAKVGTFPATVIDSDSFTFQKSASAD